MSLNNKGNQKGRGRCFQEGFYTGRLEGFNPAVAASGTLGVDANGIVVGFDVAPQAYDFTDGLTAFTAVNEGRTAAAQIVRYAGNPFAQLYFRNKFGMPGIETINKGLDVENALVVGYNYQRTVFGQQFKTFETDACTQYPQAFYQKIIKYAHTLFMGFIASQTPGQYLNGMKEAQSQAKPQVVEWGEQVTKDDLHNYSKKSYKKTTIKLFLQVRKRWLI